MIMKQLSWKLACFILGFLIILFSVRWFLVERTTNQFVYQANIDQQILLLGDSHPASSIVESSSIAHMAKSGEAWYYTEIKGRDILENNPNIRCVVIELNLGQLSPIMNDWIHDAWHLENAMKSYFPCFSVPEQWRMYSKSPILFSQKFFWF
jgi:hypothetical protein